MVQSFPHSALPRKARAPLAGCGGYVYPQCAKIDGAGATSMRNWHFCLAMLALAMAAVPGMAQPLAGKALADALKGGGYVLVMRHANSPAAAPDRANADPENTGFERQLDALGRDTARAMGEAFKKLGIPLGDVMTSPAYRARLTVRLAAFGTPKIVPDLDEGAAGMAANAQKAQADFLRAKTNERPVAGKNTILVSHAPNIAAAFGKDGEGVASGEVLVFHPGTNGGTLVARVRIEAWPKLASGL
jgi:phosphohistidine phosphatase SixA